MDGRRLGLGDRIKFVGPLEQPAELFAAMDVFALTSREDPFPLVMLEAAAAGVPVVCFAGGGGAPEFVDPDAGRVAPFLDVAGMAAAISDLLERGEERQRMGHVAAEPRSQTTHRRSGRSGVGGRDSALAGARVRRNQPHGWAMLPLFAGEHPPRPNELVLGQELRSFLRRGKVFSRHAAKSPVQAANQQLARRRPAWAGWCRRGRPLEPLSIAIHDLQAWLLSALRRSRISPNDRVNSSSPEGSGPSMSTIGSSILCLARKSSTAWRHAEYVP